MDDKNKNRNVRRKPGASAKQPPQKAPHVKPRKNPAPTPEPERKSPEVVYLAPKPFNRSRLILHLVTIAAVVVALLLGLSIFFKVEKVEVSGCSQYTAWDIQQASGIQVGDQLLTFSVPRASAKIINALPYVKTVRIGISLPDTVKIEVVETQVGYAIADTDGHWWLISAEGKVLEQCPAGKEGEHTQIRGVILKAPAVGSQAAAHETPSEDTTPVTVTAAQRLAAVLEIATELERNKIIGDAASIDVTNLYEIELLYADRTQADQGDNTHIRFQVNLGDNTQIGTKVMYLKSFVDDYSKNKPYEKGALDLSDPQWIEYDSFVEDEE